MLNQSIKMRPFKSFLNVVVTDKKGEFLYFSLFFHGTEKWFLKS